MKLYIILHFYLQLLTSSYAASRLIARGAQTCDNAIKADPKTDLGSFFAAIQAFDF
ncbi:MAG: hypothetical protein LKJ48_09230 [Lactobacillus sp.]|jgi:hypothetical protein|nr:hypothetical protein [Lactobacillus sp.]